MESRIVTPISQRNLWDINWIKMWAMNVENSKCAFVREIAQRFTDATNFQCEWTVIGSVCESSSYCLSAQLVPILLAKISHCKQVSGDRAAAVCGLDIRLHIITQFSKVDSSQVKLKCKDKVFVNSQPLLKYSFPLSLATYVTANLWRQTHRLWCLCTAIGCNSMWLWIFRWLALNIYCCLRTRGIYIQSFLRSNLVSVCFRYASRIKSWKPSAELYYL